MVLTALVLASLAFTGSVTNLDLAERVVGEACSSVSDSLRSTGLGTFTLEITGDHPGNWLVEQCIKNELDESGFSVVAAPSERDTASGSAARLSVRPMALSILFGEVSRPWLIGARRVDRIASCELYTELLDSTGTVIMSIRTSSSASDRIAFSDLPELQGATDQVWLSGGQPASQGGGLLEPLVVTGVVASLIYLFYSSRAE